MAVKIRELLDAGTPASQIAVLFRTNGQSEAYEQALASAGIGYQLRGGERFFARKEVRDAILQLRAATRAVAETATPEPLGPAGPRHRRLPRLHGRRPAQRRRPPGTLGIAGGPGGARRRTGAQPGRAVQPRRLRQRTPGTLPRPACPHRPGRDPGLAARRQGPGMGRRLPGRAQRGAHADLLRGHSRGRGRGTAAAVRRDHPGPRAPVPVLVHRPDTGRPRQPQAVPLPGRTAARTPWPAPRVRGKGAAPRRKAAVPASCRVCGSMLSSGAERKVGRCNQCPPSYEEQTFDALRQWRKDVALEADVPAFVVFTDATLTAIAEARPDVAGRAGQTRRRGPVEAGEVRRGGAGGTRRKHEPLMAGDAGRGQVTPPPHRRLSR